LELDTGARGKKNTRMMVLTERQRDNGRTDGHDKTPGDSKDRVYAYRRAVKTFRVK